MSSVALAWLLTELKTFTFPGHADIGEGTEGARCGAAELHRREGAAPGAPARLSPGCWVALRSRGRGRTSPAWPHSTRRTLHVRSAPCAPVVTPAPSSHLHGTRVTSPFLPLPLPFKASSPPCLLKISLHFFLPHFPSPFLPFFFPSVLLPSVYGTPIFKFHTVSLV